MRVSVMHWNVWYRENIDNVVDVVREVDPDVVCMQELTEGYPEQTKENTWEYVKHKLGLYCMYQTIPIKTDVLEWQQANAIFSKYPIKHRRTHWLHSPVDASDPNDQRRGYLEVTIDLNKALLSVATTHMSFEEYPEGDDSELQELLNVTQNKSRQFVLTGDMNAIPGSDRIKALDSRFSHAGPDYAENTWTTKPHKTPEFEATTLSKRYDYVYTTPDVKVVEAKIVPTDVSDHLPILVTLDVSD